MGLHTCAINTISLDCKLAVSTARDKNGYQQVLRGFCHPAGPFIDSPEQTRRHTRETRIRSKNIHYKVRFTTTYIKHIIMRTIKPQN